MNRYRLVLVFIVLLPLLMGCSSPEAKKAKHIKSGEEYLEKGKLREAIIEFKNALQINSRDARAHYKLGLAHIKIGDRANLQNAFKELSRSIEIDPNIMDAHLKIGMLYLLSREFDKSIEKAEMVLKKEPKNVEAHVLLGNSLAGQKKFDQGITEIKKALEEDPKQISPILWRSVCIAE